MIRLKNFNSVLDGLVLNNENKSAVSSIEIHSNALPD